MLKGDAKSLAVYCEKKPTLQSVCDFLSSHQLESMETGVHDLENGSFAIVKECDTVDLDTEHFEAHRVYDDLHYIIRGRETIFVENIKNCKDNGGYCPQDDYQFFFSDKPQGVSLNNGDWVLLEPEDVHFSDVTSDKKENVRKIVFKLKR